MASEFIALHVHSHYSLLDGLAKIDELINKAIAEGMEALAITDHGVMYGAIELYKKAQKAGIKPIIGCEVYIAPRQMTDKQPKIDSRPHHLVLLAKNMIGYKNLIKLVSESHLKGFYYKPRVDKELLQKYNIGLIAMTACLHGEIPKQLVLNKYDEAKSLCDFYIKTYGKENFFLELQHHEGLPDQEVVNKGLKKLSKDLGLDLVCTNDSHYLNYEDEEAHEVLLSVQTGKDLDDQSRLTMKDIDLSFIETEKAKKWFGDAPEAIENTVKIAKMCELDLGLGNMILPKFEVPEGKTSLQYLRELTQIGYEKRYKKDNLEAKKRLEYEFSVVEKTGYEDYFLIVQDYINWARANGVIVGPGRGSAAGSIVAYCLGITNIEPMRYGLLFERFLNPERISMPDIDTDFDDDKRDLVIEYVKNKYGEDHVAQIITFGTMAARGSIRDTARALGMAYSDGDRLAKLIPMGYSIKKSLDEVKEIKQIYSSEPEMKHLIDMAKKLEGVARHASTHACGVVISKEPLTEYLPLQQATKGSTSITTQYPMNDIEAIGLLKMDFLGLSNLTVIKNCLRIIRKTKDKNINIDEIPIDDKKTYELLSRGETTGVFQLESDGMKRYIKELKPNIFEDIMVMVALYRPGPLQFIPTYISRKFGREPIEYLHPKLEGALKETYGIPVYQEQVMRASRDLAGFTGGQADTLRKAIGKKIASLMAEVKIKFIAGCKSANNIDEEISNKIWQLFEDFAAYGFNKSHACCYAFIAYQTAYLKANYPAEFMAALLTSDFGNLDRIAIETSECEHMGIKVLPPSANRSFVEFGVIKDEKDKESISFGLSAIKNVGVGVADAITEERKVNGPYKNLEDFLLRLGSNINKKVVESLAKCGAFDDFLERNQIIFNMDTILKFASGASKEKQNGQSSLFGELNIKASEPKLILADTEPADKRQRLAWEKELLGLYISEHPMSDLMHIISAKARNLSSITNEDIGKRTRVAGVISDIKKIITKSKEPMLFVKLEDTMGELEAIVFPRLLKESFEMWRVDNVVFVSGRIDNKDGSLKILAENIEEANTVKEIEKLDELSETTEKKSKNKTENTKVIVKEEPKQNWNLNPADRIVVLTFSKVVTKEILAKIKELVEKNPGESSMILKVSQNDGHKEIKLKSKIKISPEFISFLTEILGKDKIEIL